MSRQSKIKVHFHNLISTSFSIKQSLMKVFKSSHRLCHCRLFIYHFFFIIGIFILWYCDCSFIWFYFLYSIEL